MAIGTSWTNHLLVAMPSMQDPNFERAVVYVCEHNVQGTIGLIINRPMVFHRSLVFEQLNIQTVPQEQLAQPLLFGGPVQPERGFVLHRPTGGEWRSSIILDEHVSVTTSNDIIYALAEEPKKNALLDGALIVLGYSGWTESQLNDEMTKNHWLVCPFKEELLYDVPFVERWGYAGKLMGIDMYQLTSDAGHA